MSLLFYVYMHNTQYMYTTASLVHMLLTILSLHNVVRVHVRTYVRASMQTSQTASLCILSSVSVPAGL